MSSPTLVELPIFPLNTVLFPGGLLPLRVFETRYIDMSRRCLREKRPFGVCLIKSGQEVGKPAEPETVGSLAHVIDCDMREAGILHLRVRGGQGFRIASRSETPQGLVIAQVEMIAAEQDAPVPQIYAACVRILQLIVADKARAAFLEPYAYESASWVGYRLAEVLPVPLIAKQKLLEYEGGVGRLQILYRFLEGRGLIGAGNGGAG